MDLIITPILRVNCPNVENHENTADQFCTSLVYSVYCMYYSKFGFWVKMPKIDWPGSQDFKRTLDMGVFIWSMSSPDCKDIKIAMEEVFFRGT